MELGEFIEALEAQNEDATIVCVDAVTGERVGNIGSAHSWRGAYRELAFDSYPREVTVAEALSEARSAVGATFEGYKGGDFTMDEQTSVYSAEYGAMGNRILGVRERDGRVEVVVTNAIDLW